MKIKVKMKAFLSVATFAVVFLVAQQARAATSSTYTSTPALMPEYGLGFGTVSYTPVLNGGTIVMKVRSCLTSSSAACDTERSGAHAWTVCSALADNTDTNAGGCMTAGDPYVQYQVTLSTSDLNVPSFGPVQINNKTGYSTAWQNLISSPFDSGDSYTSISNLTWTGGTGTTSPVKFQMRTAPDNGSGAPDWANGSGWCGAGDAINCSQTMANGKGGVKTQATAGNTPYDIAVDSDHGYVWVANASSANISQISMATGLKIRDIATGSWPYSIALDSIHNYVWVANKDSDTVSQISITSGTKIRDIAVGSKPVSIAVDSAGGYVWVANSMSNSISRISISTGVRVPLNISVGDGPKSVAIDRTNGYAWVTNVNSNTVSQISIATGLKIKDIPTDSMPIGVAVDSDHGYVWVSNFGTDNVSQISIATGTKIRDIAVGNLPYAIVVDSVNGYVWVANTSGTPRTISQISIATGLKIRDIAVGSMPQIANVISVDSINGHVWVANSDGASQIDIATGIKMRDISIGGTGYAISVDNIGGNVWVGAGIGNTINRIPIFDYYAIGTGNTINSSQANTAHTTNKSRWVQYATFVQSTDGISAPTPVTNVTTSFSFNSPPAITGANFAQMQSGADASKVKAIYSIADADVGSVPADPVINNQAYQAFFYRPNGIALSDPIDAVNTTTIKLANFASQSMPTSGFLLLDNELIKYTGYSGTTTLTLTGVTRGAAFDNPSSAYPTVAVAHTNALAYFKANSVVYDTGNPIITTATTPTAHSITWDAKNEPNMSASLNNSVWQTWTFKVVANDKGYGSNMGSTAALSLNTVTATSPSYLDLKAPVITNILPANNAYVNAAGLKVGFTNDENLFTDSAKFVFTRTAGSADANVHTCTLKPAALLLSGTHNNITLDTTNCNETTNLANLVDGATYNMVFSGSDMYGNLLTAPAQVVTYDTTPPIIVSVGAVTPNTSYDIGPVQLKFNMSESISVVSGAPVITLKAGVNTRTCTLGLVSVGSETQYPTCTYSVLAGDDTLQLYVSAISNQTFLKDRAGNGLVTTLTLTDANNLKQDNVVIDTISQKKIRGDVKFRGDVTINDFWLPLGATCDPANDHCRGVQCSINDQSAYVCGASICGGMTSISRTDNGITKTYGTIAAADGKCWLDRNLGATSYPTAISNDSNFYGWLFQWGRRPDGHQFTVYSNGSYSTSVSATASLSDADIVAPPYDVNFIKGTFMPNDWRNPQSPNAANLWGGARDNNPCPTGFHVPTIAEWGALVSASGIKDAATAYASQLKLIPAGIREYYQDTSPMGGTLGYYWSSDISTDPSLSKYFYFNNSGQIKLDQNYFRAAGLSVRCIKD